MFRAAFRRLLALDDPPERTALAFAVGIFIAFSPFLGLHTLMATALAFLLRFNKVAIYTGTFINNPFTLVPVIIASYAVGAFLMGRPLGLPDESLELLKHPQLFEKAYWSALFARTGDVLLPFAIGGMILSIVGALVSYPAMLYPLRARLRHTSKKEAADEDKAGDAVADEVNEKEDAERT